MTAAEWVIPDGPPAPDLPGVNPSSETRKWVTVLERRTDAWSASPCLQSGVQGGRRTPDLGWGEGEGRGGRAPRVAQTAVPLVGPVRGGGAEALVPPGRPPRSAVWAQRPRPAPKRARKPKQKRGTPEEAAAAERVAERERKVGQQALELDFFARALRHVKASARANDGRGAGASSP